MSTVLKWFGGMLAFCVIAFAVALLVGSTLGPTAELVCVPISFVCGLFAGAWWLEVIE
jgi:hypothetical protein